MSFVFEFEPSGKIEAPDQFSLAKLDEHNAIVVFTQGTMQDGRHYYAYVAIKPSLYKEFNTLTKAGQPVILSQYGEVIAAGFSFNPPQEVVEKMRRKYGCDPEFQERLINEAFRQQQVFLSKKRDQRVDEIVGVLKRRKNKQE